MTLIMGGDTSRKRHSEAELRQTGVRRGKIEVEYIVTVFERQMIANNGYCIHCGKEIMSLNDQA